MLDLAGTEVGDQIIAGDDAPAWRALGHDVLEVTVLCSRRIAAGEQTLPAERRTIPCAIDCNGRSGEDVAGIAGADLWRPAVGIYAGERAPAILAYLRPEQIVPAHDRLLAHLAGFGCFAVFA